MDPLVLLCNLHADGPSTVRRLQYVGISTLEHVMSASVDDLAEHLYGPPSLARRFQAEAEVLARRVMDDLLEEEPSRREGRWIPAAAGNAYPEPRTLSAPRGRPQAAAPIPPGFEALDAQALEALARRGVRTPQDLVREVSMDLARATGIPLPQLIDLAYLARQAAHPPGHAADRPVTRGATWTTASDTRAALPRSDLQHQT